MNSKILVLLPYAFFRSSGSSQSSYYRVLALLELGYKLDIVTYPHGDDISQKNLRIIRCPSFRIFRDYLPGQYWKKICYDFFCTICLLSRSVINKYDFIIPSSSMVYITGLLSSLFRSRLIANMHGNLDIEFIKWDISKRKFSTNLASRVELYSLKRFDHIICEHKSVFEKLKTGKILDSKLSLIGLAVKGEEQLRKIVRPDTKFTILYTGTFVNVQNLDLLFEAAKLLQDQNVIFQCIGGTVFEIKRYNKRLIADKINDIVFLYERKDKEKLKVFYRDSDIVISPRTIGFDTPMKIIDYLNFGKCILATDLPIHTEVLNTDNAILVNPTAEAIAEKIIFLKNNYQIIQEYEDKAKHYFEANFDFQYMVKSYANLFEQLSSI